MARCGRPPGPYPRRQGIFGRVSDIEWGALHQALQAEYPVPGRQPTLPEWIRDLIVAPAGEVLRVEVTRAGLRHAPGGAPNWKRWRLTRAVRRAAPRRRKSRR